MRLLLVRDGSGPLRELRGWLPRGDFAVVEAETLAAAAAHLCESQPQVAILSTTMPDGSGIEFLETHRAALATTGIVFVAQNGRPEEIVRAMKLGASDFLVEPIEKERALQAVVDAAAAAATGAQIVPLDEIEFIMVERALRAAGGNQSQAARLLQVTRDQLRYRVKRYRDLGRLTWISVVYGFAALLSSGEIFLP